MDTTRLWSSGPEAAKLLELAWACLELHLSPQQPCPVRSDSPLHGQQRLIHLHRLSGYNGMASADKVVRKHLEVVAAGL
jgi:hypothetical protein